MACFEQRGKWQCGLCFDLSMKMEYSEVKEEQATLQSNLFMSLNGPDGR